MRVFFELNVKLDIFWIIFTKWKNNLNQYSKLSDVIRKSNDKISNLKDTGDIIFCKNLVIFLTSFSFAFFFDLLFLTAILFRMRCCSYGELDEPGSCFKRIVMNFIVAKWKWFAKFYFIIKIQIILNSYFELFWQNYIIDVYFLITTVHSNEYYHGKFKKGSNSVKFQSIESKRA